MHQSTHNTQDIHYNIPSDWVFHNSPSVYMDRDGWHKSMAHFSSMCFSSHLNSQVLFYDGHGIHFDNRSLNMICRHNIQYFILKSCDYVHDHPNDKCPNMKLNIFYGNSRMNYTRHHGTLNFSPPHINYFLVETWKDFKLSSAKISQKYFKKTHLLLLSPLDIGKNYQAFLAGTQ